MRAEMLIASTTARGVSYGAVGGSTKEKLTALDVALAARNVTRLQWGAARLALAGDFMSKDEMVEHVVKCLYPVALKESWRVPCYARDRKRAPAIEELGHLAILEMGHPGQFKNNAMRATLLDVSESAYYRTWRPRYEMAYRVINDLVIAAVDVINRDNAEGVA